MWSNKINTDKQSIRIREDLGWVHLKKQLDIELPQQKKDRRLFWLFLLGTGLLGGYALLRTFEVHPIPAVSIPVETPAVQTPINNQETAELAPTTNDQTSAIATASASTVGDKKENLDNYAAVKPASQKRNPKKSVNSAENTSNRSEALTQKQKLNTNLPIAGNNSTVQFESKNNLTATPQGQKPNGPIKNETDQNAGTAMMTKKLHISFLPHTPMQVFESIGDDLAMPLFALSGDPVILNQKKMPKSTVFIQGGMSYLSNQRWSSSLLAGVPLDLGKKIYVNFQAGLTYQYSHNSILLSNNNAPGSVQSAVPGSSKQLDAGSTYSVKAAKIFIDPTNSFTGFRQDSLFVSSNDQVTYHSSAQFTGTLRTGLGFRMTKRLFFESGIDFRLLLGNSKDKLWVQYVSPVNNGFNNTTLTNSTFNIEQAQAKNRTSLYLQGGYTINHRWSLNGAITSRPINFTSNRSLLYQADLTTGSTSRKVFDGASRLPFIFDLSLRYSF